MRTATSGEILELLRNRSHEVRQLIKANPVQFFLSTTKNTPAIQVFVKKGQSNLVPKQITMKLDTGEEVTIPLESEENYQDYKPLNRA